MSAIWSEWRKANNGGYFLKGDWRTNGAKLITTGTFTIADYPGHYPGHLDYPGHFSQQSQ
jgi:hypothetical protein